MNGWLIYALGMCILALFLSINQKAVERIAKENDCDVTLGFVFAMLVWPIFVPAAILDLWGYIKYKVSRL